MARKCGPPRLCCCDLTEFTVISSYLLTAAPVSTGWPAFAGHDKLGEIAVFLLDCRRDLFHRFVVHADALRARKTVEHGAHQRLLRHGFDLRGVLLAFLF